MRRNVLFGSLFVLALTTAACQDQVTDSSPQFGPTPQASVEDAGLDRSISMLPANALIADRRELALNPAINPSDYVCPASTDVVDWWLGEVYAFIGAEPAIFNLLYGSLLADLVVMYEALYLVTDATPQYFGYNGEYTDVMNKTHKDAKRFWDIYSDDIQLIGMHGSMLQDPARVAATYQFVWGLPPATAAYYASLVQNAVASSQVLNGGDHALFSFNAFAISAPGFIPDKIVMGDAIMAGYAALGFGDVAPQAIYAHEFAHHIQFENGYFSDVVGTPPEQTRYTELMADAYSAYFLTHKRGAAMNQKRVAQFLEVFYQIGDCGFTSGGHHGTPNQRMRAAQFGFELANQAQKQGHILGSEAFYQLFVAEYPNLIAPDA